MDVWTTAKRSEVMSKIKSGNTKPEIILRKALFSKGYRFRLHQKSLPGKPDIILPKYRTVIFVHGCFWHYHQSCWEGKIPKSNTSFWKGKLARNIERDQQNEIKLTAIGWQVVIVWECEIEKNLSMVLTRLITLIKS